MPSDKLKDLEKKISDLKKDAKDQAILLQKKDTIEVQRQPKDPNESMVWSEGAMLDLSCYLLVFGVLIAAIITFLATRKKSLSSLLTTYGILVIVILSVFLVVAGYSSSQLTPVIGLLGTIAGHLLAKRGDSNTETKTKDLPIKPEVEPPPEADKPKI